MVVKWTPLITPSGQSASEATLCLYSLSGKMSYRQISWDLEATRLGIIMIVSLWNLTGMSAAALSSAAAEVPVKFQSDWNGLHPNLAASRLHGNFW